MSSLQSAQTPLNTIADDLYKNKIIELKPYLPVLTEWYSDAIGMCNLIFVTKMGFVFT